MAHVKFKFTEGNTADSKVAANYNIGNSLLLFIVFATTRHIQRQNNSEGRGFLLKSGFGKLRLQWDGLS